MPATTLGNDVSAYNGAVTYLRDKVAAFRRLGTVELPALRQQASAVWFAADRAGDSDLTRRAHGQFTAITDAQQEWELQNDTLQSILSPLRAVGVNLGALPAVWVVVAAITLAGSMVAIFALRDRSRTIIADLCRESVAKGQMSARECQDLLGATEPPPLIGIGGVGLGLVALGIGAFVFLRRR